MPLRANGHPRRPRRAGYPAGYRYLFDALVPVGHDFGIEIDGFRAPGI